jgi:putative oxidoreductase
MRQFSALFWNNVSLLVLRLILAVVFIPHGWGKWDRGLSTTAQWLDQKGYPLSSLMAILLITFEALGPLFMIPGLFTRLVALGWIVVMTLAILTVHVSGGLKGMEFPLVIWGGSFVLFLQGGGRWSLDSVLTPFFQNKLGFFRRNE